MDTWLQYLQERYSLFYYGGLAAGIALSGMHLFNQAPSFLHFSFSFFAILLYFAQARLIDDYQDFDDDVIAHSGRTHFVKKAEFARFIVFFQITLVFFALLMLVFVSTVSVLFYLIAMGYLWIIHRQFYKWKKYFNKPLWHLWAYPITLVPIALFAVTIADPLEWKNSKVIGFVLVLLGAFITNDFCRKLNPHAHPILMTFRQFYGYKKTFWVAAGSLLVSAIGAALMQTGSFLWPCEFVVLITLLFPFYRSESAHFPKVAGVFSLFIHAWSGFILWLFLV